MLLILYYLTVCIFIVTNGHHPKILTEGERINYIEKLINDFKASVQTYQRPVDNSRFKPANEDINHFDSYDFIIVGGGSAGSTLASRLSEVSHFNILLVEAGQEEGDFSKIPAAMLAIINSPLDWGYKTVPQTNSCLGEEDHRCAYPRGLSIGGSSAINAMAYIRGNAYEYNLWGSNHSGWSYRDLLFYFKKSERAQMDNIDRPYHGFNGPLHVEHNQRHWLVDDILSASAAIGAPYNADYNGRDQLGATIFQQTTWNGVRQSANTAYLSPIRQNRRNLRILTGAFVIKVLTEKRPDGVAAVGIEFSYQKKKWQAIARKEVILCAGAVNTPHILMHSGIGSADELSKLGIALVADIRAVGKNLADHPGLFSISCTTNQTDFDNSLRGHIADYVKGVGNLATVLTHVVDFIQYDYSHSRYPDFELMINPKNNALLRYLTDANYTDPTGPDARIPLSLDLIVMVMYPKSRGSVTTVSADPYEFPQIDPRFLTHPDDMKTMLESVSKAIKLLKTVEMKRINAKIDFEMAPEACGKPNVNSPDYWTCYIRHQTSSLFHPMGTCRMGDVVDAQLRVMGVKSLRIADASVIPIIVAGHTNAVCIAIGEKAADIIKRDFS